MRLPDFIIIGAMKSATSTLHEQLAGQAGIFMSDPKELYFFSDDPVYAKGIDWYASHFADAPAGSICGESTTHYTKLPTYPKTIERMCRHIPHAKLIYIMRHPIDRLVSQYIHQWTENEITLPLVEAIEAHPELIAYSRYTMQLQPFFNSYGQENVLPIFFDQIRQQPQAILEHVCRFIGYDGTPTWQELERQNVSAQRMRSSGWRDKLTYAPGISQIRQYLIPQAVRDKIKGLWQMQARPDLPDDARAKLEKIFNEDLAQLGKWLDINLNCANFKAVTSQKILNWK
jgi:hypothetical protein